jgi:hypothetical protein
MGGRRDITARRDILASKNTKEGNMEPVKINQLHAFEFDNGQDLLHGPVGTWFVAPENKVVPLKDNPGKDEVIFVRSESCGPGWYQSHPKADK